MKNLINNLDNVLRNERCSKSGKVIFTSENSAKNRALNISSNSLTMTVYKCNHCGYYHLSHERNREKNDSGYYWREYKRTLGQEKSNLIKFI